MSKKQHFNTPDHEFFEQEGLMGYSEKNKLSNGVSVLHVGVPVAPGNLRLHILGHHGLSSRIMLHDPDGDPINLDLNVVREAKVRDEKLLMIVPDHVMIPKDPVKKRFNYLWKSVLRFFSNKEEQRYRK